MNKYFKCIIAGCALFLLSCATGSSFSSRPENFPMDHLNRSIQLPAGFTSWHFITGQSIGKPWNPYVYPLYWEKGVSDRWTVTFMPLPLEVRYLVFETPDRSVQWNVLGSFLGQIVSRNKNFDWRPTFRSKFRKRLDSRWAIESEALALMEITRDEIGNPGSTFGLKFQVQHQLLPTLFLGTGFWAMRENGTTRANYVGSLPLQNEGIASERSRLRFPFQVDAVWTLSAQWDLRMESQIFAVGYDADFRSANLFLSVVHTW